VLSLTGNVTEVRRVSAPDSPQAAGCDPNHKHL